MADRSYNPDAIQDRQREAANASRQKQEALLEKARPSQPEQPVKPSQKSTEKPTSGTPNYSLLAGNNPYKVKTPTAAPLDNLPKSKPYLAYDVTTSGLAVFGNGLQGWIRKSWADLTDPKKYQQDLGVLPEDVQQTILGSYENRVDTWSSIIEQKTKWSEWGEKAFNLSARDLAALPAGLSTERQITKEISKEEGDTALEAFGREAGTLLSRQVRTGVDTVQNAAWGGLEVLSLGDKFTRKINSAVMGVDAVADKFDYDEADNVFESLTQTGGISFTKDVYTITRAILDKRITLQETTKGVVDYMAGSEMVYTMMFDNAARHKFELGLKEEKNPILLAQEYGNTGIELAGSIIGDPTTFLGWNIIKPVNLFSKTGRLSAKTVTMFGKTIPLPYKVIGKIPTFAEFIGANADNAKLANASARFINNSIPELETVLEKAGDIKDDRAAIELIDKAVLSVTNKLDDMRKHKNFWNLSSVDNVGKIRRVSSDADYFIKGMLAEHGLNDTLQIISDMKLLRAGGEDAANAAKRLIPRGGSVFSDVGMMVGEIMYRLDNDNILEAVKNSRNTADTYDGLYRSLEKAVSDFIPSVDDMLEAEKKLKLGDTSERVAQLADMAKDLPAAVRIVNKITRPAEKVSKAATRGMVEVFMNFVPRSWARNIYGQSVMLALHTDLETALTASVEAFTKGISKSGTTDVLEKMNSRIVKALGFSPIESMKGIGDAMQVTKTKWGFLPAMQRSEQLTASQIILKTAGDEIQKALPAVMKNLPEWDNLAATMTKEQQSVMQLALKRANGNTEEALTLFRDIVGKGEIEAWRLAEPPANMRRHLESINMMGEFYDIQKNAKTAGEFKSFLTNFVNTYTDSVKKAAEKLPSTSTKTPKELYDFGVDLAKTADPSQKNIVTELIQGWQNTLDQLSETSHAIIQHALRVTQGTPGFEMVMQADNQIKSFSGLASEQYRTINTLRENIHTLKKTVQETTDKQELVRLWKQGIDYRGKSFNLSTIYPDMDLSTMTPQLFQRKMWQAFFETSSEVYRNGNNAAYTKTMDVLEKLANDIGTPLESLAARQGDDNPLFLLQKMYKETEDIEDAVSWRRFLNQFNFEKMPTKPDGTPVLLKDVAGKFEETFKSWKGGQKHIVNAVNQDVKGSRKIIGGIDVTSIKDKAKAIKEGTAESTSEDVLKYLEQARKTMLDKQKEFGAAQRAARKTGEVVKVKYDNMTQVIMSLPNEAASFTLEQIAKRAAQYGVEIPNELKTFFESAAGNASRREVLEFAANIELGNSPKMLNRGITYEQITLEQAYKAIWKRTRVPPYDGTINEARIMWETKDAFLDDVARWGESVVKDWGVKVKSTGVDDTPELKNFVSAFEKRMNPIRQMAGRVAVNTRDFILHDYDKTYMDHALSYLYGNSFHYWTTRTYAKSVETLLANPGVGSAYLKYKNYITKEHAEMPEFYRQNTVVDNLLGVDLQNPYYLNLESMINPVYGLTGTDFNDPRKRVDWVTRLVDDSNKMGPSFSPLISWALAAKLYMDGKDGAAQRWLGRMLPQSQIIKSATSKIFGKAIEVDPFVMLSNKKFFGGVDAYERNRVVASLAMMVRDGQITQEQMIDAARAEEGELWEAAIQASAEKRFSGDVASFFLGVGARPRTQEDLIINKFWGDYSALLSSKTMMTPEQYRVAWEKMRDNPDYGMFVDGLLLGRKTGDEQRSAFAYNVLSRIPPGELTPMVEKLGLKPYMVEAFYGNKGDLSSLTPQDRARFEAAMVDLAVMLKLPDGATKTEWNAARATYSEMKSQMESEFGSDIFDKINDFYNLEDSDAKDRFMEAFPEVKQALEAQNKYIVNTPILSAYYGGLETVERYYTTQVYNQLGQEFGEDIDDKVQTYNLLMDNLQEAEAKQFYKENNLKAYFDRRKVLLQEIDDDIINAASQIPEPKGAEIRPEFQSQSGYQSDAFQQATTDQQAQTAQQIWSEISPAAQALIQESLQSGEELPSPVKRQLTRIAEKYGLSQYEALRLLGVEQ